jgi:hypothetical protein
MSSTRICTHCSISFTPKQGSTGKFCGSSCAAKFNNTGRKRTDESKQRTSQIFLDLIEQGAVSPPPTKYGKDNPKWKGGPIFHDRGICATCDSHLTGAQKKYCATCSEEIKTQKRPRSLKTNYRHKCLMCNTIIDGKRKTCSQTCLTERNRQTSSDHLRKNRHKYVGPTQRSWMEQTFVEWLEAHGISKGVYGYWDQVHFKHRPDGKTKNGWADFVFVSRRLIIELDGSHHKKRTHLDAVRDAHLSDRRGYKVIRITHTEYVKKIRLQEIALALGI